MRTWAGLVLVCDVCDTEGAWSKRAYGQVGRNDSLPEALEKRCAIEDALCSGLIQSLTKAGSFLSHFLLLLSILGERR